MEEQKHGNNPHKDEFLKDVSNVLENMPVPLVRAIEKTFAHVEAVHFLTVQKEMEIYEPNDAVILKITREAMKIVTFGKYLHLLEDELLKMRYSQQNESSASTAKREVKISVGTIDEILSVIAVHKAKSY